MLLVRTKLGASNIHGTGVFTEQPIAAGQTVWEFFPGIDLKISKNIIDVAVDPIREFFKHFAWPYNGIYYLDADHSRWINHSDTPNLITGIGTEPMIAAKNIWIGEELTCNYRQFDLNMEREGI